MKQRSTKSIINYEFVEENPRVHSFFVSSNGNLFLIVFSINTFN